MNPSILQGLTNFAGLGDSTDPVSNVFREPISLSIAPYDPDLPQLPPAPNTQIAALPIENESEVSGAEMGEYEEVQSVEIM